MSYTKIEMTVADGVATISLNRPDAMNALDLEMTEEFMDAAIQCEERADIRAVVFTGKGRMFCAGGDLAFFAGFKEELGAKLKAMTGMLHVGISRFMRMDPPVVVAVNGTAAGAGFSLALIGDIVISAESAKYTMAYTAAGLSPDGSSTYVMPRIIGLRRTQELMLTNRRLSAAEALEWGLITRVVPDDHVMAEATALARDLATGPTRAYGAVKSMLAETFTSGPEVQMEREARSIAAMARTSDVAEGIDAFLNKRKPAFRAE